MIDKNEISILLLGFALLVLGFIVGAMINDSVVSRQIIDRGGAIYHPKTGAFTWKILKEGKKDE